MRFTLTHWIVIAIMLSAGTVPVQRLMAQENDEADHEALREMRRVVEEAINTNQLELFKPYLADEFSIVTYTDREFSDFDVFQAQWQKTRDKLLAGGSYSTTMNPELSQILGDVAIARGNSSNVLTTGSGATYNFPSNWTAVLQKVDGQWKVVRAHSSLSPFDNPMLRAGVKSMLLKVGAATAAAGFVVGCLATWFVGRLRRKKSSGLASA